MTHISNWVDFYTYWLKNFKGPTHVVYYNNLKEKPHSELLGAINFLGLQPDIVRLNCTAQFPKSAYFKRPNKPPPVDKFILFRLSMSKAMKAVQIFKDLVLKKYGSKHPVYQRFNLEISVQKLK